MQVGVEHLSQTARVGKKKLVFAVDGDQRPATSQSRGRVEECCAVAQAAGVALPAADALYDAALQLGQAMSPATSSTEQDLARGKRTEIESLNGYVARRGDALGVPAPANRALTTLVLLRETSL